MGWSKIQRAIIAVTIGVIFLALTVWQLKTDPTLSFFLALGSFFSFMAVPAFIYPPNAGDPKHEPFVPPPKKPMEPSEVEKEISHLQSKFEALGAINIFVGIILIVLGVLGLPSFLLIFAGVFEIILGIFLLR
jgi:small-conductance mechanosensitive channel